MNCVKKGWQENGWDPALGKRARMNFNGINDWPPCRDWVQWCKQAADAGKIAGRTRLLDSSCGRCPRVRAVQQGITSLQSARSGLQRSRLLPVLVAVVDPIAATPEKRGWL